MKLTNKFNMIAGGIGLFLTLSAAHATGSEDLAYECTSPEIGTFRVKLTSTRPDDAELKYSYNTELTRYANDGNIIEVRYQNEKSTLNEDENQFWVRADAKRNYVMLRLPASNATVDYSATDCYIKSKVAGVWLDVDTVTGAVVTPDGLKPSIFTSILNPAAKFYRARQGIYWIDTPFVNGVQCDLVGPNHGAKILPVCHRISL